jgi:hypothetical protein
MNKKIIYILTICLLLQTLPFIGMVKADTTIGWSGSSIPDELSPFELQNIRSHEWEYNNPVDDETGWQIVNVYIPFNIEMSWSNVKSVYLLVNGIDLYGCDQIFNYSEHRIAQWNIASDNVNISYDDIITFEIFQSSGYAYKTVGSYYYYLSPFLSDEDKDEDGDEKYKFSDDFNHLDGYYNGDNEMIIRDIAYAFTYKVNAESPDEEILPFFTNSNVLLNDLQIHNIEQYQFCNIKIDTYGDTGHREIIDMWCDNILQYANFKFNEDTFEFDFFFTLTGEYNLNIRDYYHNETGLVKSYFWNVTPSTYEDLILPQPNAIKWLDYNTSAFWGIGDIPSVLANFSYDPDIEIMHLGVYRESSNTELWGEDFYPKFNITEPFILYSFEFPEEGTYYIKAMSKSNLSQVISFDSTYVSLYGENNTVNDGTGYNQKYDTDVSPILGLGVTLGVGTALTILTHSSIGFIAGASATAYVLSSDSLGEWQLLPSELGYALIAIMVIAGVILWLA